MESYTIAEEYTLPSLGKVYSSTHVEPRVKIRSMTIEEEMKRLSPTDRPNKMICEIIDDCLVEKPGISAYDMCIADEQFLLHKLRIVTYGTEYRTVSTCPYCGCNTNSTINLESLTVNQYTDDLRKYFEFDLPVSKKHIRIRMQTPRMMDTIEERKKEIFQKNPMFKGEPAILLMAEYMIESVDHIVLTELELEDFIRSLPMKDINYILQCGKKLNESFGIDLSFQVDCSVCGLDYRSPFRTTSEFFGPSID